MTLLGMAMNQSKSVSENQRFYDIPSKSWAWSLSYLCIL